MFVFQVQIVKKKKKKEKKITPGLLAADSNKFPCHSDNKVCVYAMTMTDK